MNIVQWITSSIRNKMLIITGTGTTLLLASALLGLWMTWSHIATMQHESSNHLEEAHAVSRIEESLGKQIHEWKNTLLRGSQDAAAQQKHWGNVLDSEKKVLEEVQSLKAMSEDQELDNKIAAFSKAYQAMNDQYERAHQVFLDSKFDIAMADHSASGADKEALKILAEIGDFIDTSGRSGNEAAAHAAMKGIKTSLVFMGIAVLIAFGVFLGALQHGIIVPTRQLVRDLDLLSQGDFSRSVTQTTQDEIGQVAASAERIRQDLGAVIANVKAASSTVARSSEDLAANSSQVVVGSEAQSEAASATAAAVEQMTVSIHSVADNAEEVRELSRNSLKNTSEGKQRLDELAGHIEQTVRSMDDIAQSVQQFVASTATITSMTQQVKDIADQTNLLALNASIEAARAGEQGRGFAVVADEVRKLAEKSAQSASEIDGVTRVLEAQSQQVSTALGRGQQFLKSSQGAMESTAAAMNQTYSAMQLSSNGVDAITDSVKEQTAASNDIARNVEHIANMAEENNASVSGISNAAHQLEDLANSLNEAVSRFKS